MVNSLASAESNRIIAAIDMGTNSFHMVVARIDPTLMKAALAFWVILS
jgi:exopolyphosphatase/guanosine-5'-triphosphate,3'-diphosphate pyrophosphatase